MRIGVYYSVGPHFARTLQRLRREYPEARLIAIVPPGLELSEDARALAGESIVTEQPHYSPRNVSANLRLIRRLRSERFDAFCVLFDSMQLEGLAALTGARIRLCCLPQGRLVRLRAPLPIIIGQEAARQALGRLVYAGVWLAVRMFPSRRTQFEFDDAKSAANLEKHGIDFIRAQQLWNDPDTIRAKAKSTDEDRHLVIGMIGRRHWAAVVTGRGDRIRLISVRRARTKEVQQYESFRIRR